MNFQDLLDDRESLVRQARLANVAFAWQRLADFAARVERAGLRGRAVLVTADPPTDGRWPALNPWSASPAVVAEHFTDEDVVELADVLAFAGVEPVDGEVRFCFEELAERFIPPLREELQRGGVTVPGSPLVRPPAADGTGRG